MSATYTVNQVAEILGYSTNSIYTFLKEKRIKGVRVGKGRFRIPQAELDRLLQTPKSKQSQATDISVSAPGDAGVHDVLPVFVREAEQIDVPSIFDWFVGLSAILVGTSMLLLNRIINDGSSGDFLVWQLPLQISFVAGGIGLLVSDISGRSKSGWHGLFQVIVASAFAVLSVMNFLDSDWTGAALYALLAGIIALNFRIKSSGVGSFSFYVSSVIVCVIPGIMVVKSESIGLISGFQSVFGDGTVFVGIFVASLVFLAALRISYARSRSAFWGLMAAVSVGFGCIALLYAGELHWSRSVFFLVLGLMSLFLPVWDTFEFSHQQDRMLVFQAFLMITVFFIAILGALRMIQSSMLEYATEEAINKVAYGKLLVESELQAIETIAQGFVSNPVFSGALEVNAPDSLTGSLRSLYESRVTFQQALVLDKSGVVVAHYPLEPGVSGTDLSLNAAYLQVIQTGETYVNEMYDSTSTRYQYVVSKAIMGPDSEAVGVLIVTMDMDELGNNLQKLADSKNGEYFVIANNSMKRLVHPVTALVYTTVDEGDLMERATKGQQGVDYETVEDGAMMLTSYSSIDGVAWGIQFKTPLQYVLRSTQAGRIAIMSLSVGSVIVALIFFMGRRSRRVLHGDGG